MINTRMMLVAFALPIMMASVWQGGSCQNSSVNTHSVSEERSDGLKTGLWGGEGIEMRVTEKGARIEFECGNGTIDRRIVPDKDGRFEASGAHTKERGGPMRGESRPASYIGRVVGRTMTLTVKLTESDETVGTFSLEHGAKPELAKCM